MGDRDDAVRKELKSQGPIPQLKADGTRVCSSYDQRVQRIKLRYRRMTCEEEPRYSLS